MNNYRPVSITSQTCKLMERILRKKITTHLEENNLLSDCQHGFTHKRSCLTNMLESLEDWTETLDRGDKLDIIYLDYRKAFDTVPHKRLLAKLYGYGIRGCILDWLKSFLTGRKQQVSVGATYSDWEMSLVGYLKDPCWGQFYL